jgi:hypothetical protein
MPIWEMKVCKFILSLLSLIYSHRHIYISLEEEEGRRKESIPKNPISAGFVPSNYGSSYYKQVTTHSY